MAGFCPHQAQPDGTGVERPGTPPPAGPDANAPLEISHELPLAGNCPAICGRDVFAEPTTHPTGPAWCPRRTLTSRRGEKSLDRLRVDRRSGAAGDDQRRAAEEELVDVVGRAVLAELLEVEHL